MQRRILLIFNFLSMASPGITAQHTCIELEKMNAVYAGAENPVSVSVSDLPDSVITVTASMGELQHKDAGHYMWKICSRDSNIATLTLRDALRDTIIAIRHYRVKRSPEPEPVLGSNRLRSGIGNGEYRASSGIAMILRNFDFDMKCETVSFEMIYLSLHQDPTPEILNTGARFNEKISSYINCARPGDVYEFFNFYYTCGCDPLVRKLDGGLYFRIK